VKFTPFVLLTIAAATALAATGNRDITHNDLSPTAESSVKLGNTTITIEYNAPSGRGRKIEGGLIPYDNWYRMGADTACTITTTGDITIGNLKVPKGVHTLYLQAKPDVWQLIVNKQTRQWGLEYHQNQDLGRVPMRLTKLSKPVEKFNIALQPTNGPEGVLDVTWGTTKAELVVKASQ
jgi:hypothetical protein